MKVAIVLKTFDLGRGGAEVWTAAYVRWLVARDHEVHLVVRKCENRVRELGATVHTIRDRSAARFARNAETRLRSLGADIVHDMGCGWYFDVFHSHVGSPVIYREKLLELKPKPKQLVGRAAAAILPSYRRKRKFADRQFAPQSAHAVYVALSNRVARDLHSRHHIDERDMVVIPNGVDTGRFTPAGNGAACCHPLRDSLGIKKQDIVLLLMAHNPSLKGLTTLIEATYRLRGEGHPLQLIVAGGAPAKADKRRVQQLGLADHVHAVGKVDDPQPYYHAADIYAHLTRYDACSLVVLEALASGLPVITSAQNGAAELVPQGFCGFVVDDPADASTTARYLRTLTDDAARQQMRLHARETAEQHTLEANFRAMLSLYDRVLHRRRSGAASSAPRAA